MIFYKMNGLGNDYVFINTETQYVENPSELAKTLSDRNFSVGSDGLVLLYPSSYALMRMEIYNKDGSRAEMCGNAVRCVVKYLHDMLGYRRDVYRIATDAGIRSVTIEEDRDGNLISEEVEMGEPILRNIVEASYHGKNYTFDRISIGNPHAVTILNKMPEDIAKIGKRFSEDKSLFPSGANIEFVKIEDKHNVLVKVYERGSGVTLACGTGATAAAYSVISRGDCESPVNVHLPGGVLTVTDDYGMYYLKGSAEFNFKGEIQKE